jgi:hypothetical protein
MITKIQSTHTCTCVLLPELVHENTIVLICTCTIVCVSAVHKKLAASTRSSERVFDATTVTLICTCVIVGLAVHNCLKLETKSEKTCLKLDSESENNRDQAHRWCTECLLSPHFFVLFLRAS